MRNQNHERLLDTQGVNDPTMAVECAKEPSQSRFMSHWARNPVPARPKKARHRRANRQCLLIRPRVLASALCETEAKALPNKPVVPVKCAPCLIVGGEYETASRKTHSVLWSTRGSMNHGSWSGRAVNLEVDTWGTDGPRESTTIRRPLPLT